MALTQKARPFYAYNPHSKPFSATWNQANSAMSRLNSFVLIVSTLVASWLGMQLVHELGHVLGAWLTGAVVAQVALDPFSISRTDLAENPRPLFVAWAGPIAGVLIPLGVWIAAAGCRASAAYLLRFFAGFCLLANGLYIGLGSYEAIGDCGDLLRNGARPWQLWLFGVLTAPLGLYLWHDQGRHFGLGTNALPVSRAAVYGAALVAVALLVLCLAF